MNKTNFSIIFLSIAIAGFILAHNHYFSHFATRTTTINTKNFAHDLAIQTTKHRLENMYSESIKPLFFKMYKTLKKEEVRIFEQIEDRFSLRLSDIKNMRTAEYLSDYCNYMNESTTKYTTSESLAPCIIQTINNVLTDMKLAPNSIGIKPWEGHSHAAIMGTTLLINQELLQELPQESQKFVIAHELIHYMYHDLCTINLLKQLMLEDKANPEDFKQFDHPVNQFSRFVEMRADTLASMLSPVYAQANITINKIELSLDKQIKSTQKDLVHPSIKDRLAQAEALLEMHKKVLA